MQCLFDRTRSVKDGQGAVGKMLPPLAAVSSFAIFGPPLNLQPNAALVFIFKHNGHTNLFLCLNFFMYM